jgi:murein DD-endopeptidase MepM/ murein hydrolase activator NlpD
MPRWGISTLLAALLAALVTAAPAYAIDSWDTVPSPPKDPFSPGHAYINPFADPAWLPARTDMGVDWLPSRRLPVLAIGDAVILGSNANDTGWPGKHIIWYQLLNGSHAGDVIYVAEHLKDLAPAGRFVRAGQKIALALPGSPYTEWGWANGYGAPLAHPCYHEGWKTRNGKEMARFMIELGASTRDKPGPGPDAPQGGHCF